MNKRTIANIVLFASLFLLPWYATVVLGVFFTIVFNNYWEVILAGLFIDSLYSTPGKDFYGKFGVFILGALILFLAIRWFKKKIRFFSD
jgi:hypothetical protein